MKQKVNCTVILPPLAFPGKYFLARNILFREREGTVHPYPFSRLFRPRVVVLDSLKKARTKVITNLQV